MKKWDAGKACVMSRLDRVKKISGVRINRRFLRVEGGNEHKNRQDHQGQYAGDGLICIGFHRGSLSADFQDFLKIRE